MFSPFISVPHAERVVEKNDLCAATLESGKARPHQHRPCDQEDEGDDGQDSQDEKKEMFQALGSGSDALRLNQETDRGEFSRDGLSLSEPMNENRQNSRSQTEQEKRVQEGDIHV